jgi:hypothetical protein
MRKALPFTGWRAFLRSIKKDPEERTAYPGSLRRLLLVSIAV